KGSLRPGLVPAALAAADEQKDVDRDEHEDQDVGAESHVHRYGWAAAGGFLRQCVLRPGAALGRREATAPGGDRAALDAVRRRDPDLDLAVATAELVHLRGAHPHP